AARIDAGPRAIAITLKKPPSLKLVAALSRHQTPTLRDDRLIYECPTVTALERLKACETLLRLNLVRKGSKAAARTRSRRSELSGADRGSSA
ncbi:MAG: hypothetical protein ABW055_02725, partial [Pararhizobium sp.]